MVVTLIVKVSAVREPNASHRHLNDQPQALARNIASRLPTVPRDVMVERNITALVVSAKAFFDAIMRPIVMNV